MADLNSKGNKDELKGKANEAAGKVRGDVGDATDNTSEHATGRMDQLKGKAQQGMGKVEKALDPDNNSNTKNSNNR